MHRKKKVNTGITRIFRQHKFLEFRHLNIYDENRNSNFDFWYLFLFYEVVAESKITLWIDIRIIGIVCKLRYEEETAPADYARKALLCVACRHLTPPPSSTNVERLFSIGGLTATDHRASLSGEKLDQILFLRENALMANFNLGWQWSSNLLYIYIS